MIVGRIFEHPVPMLPWDRAPVRGELFGAERLEQHARSLAEAQPVTKGRTRDGRLADNAAFLLQAIRALAKSAEDGHHATPAAKWLDGTLGFAGEESGRESFLRRDGSAWTTDRDGLIVGLLAAEIMGRTGTNPAAAYDRIAHDLGQSWYERIDALATAAERMQLKAVTPEGIGMAELAGETVRATITAAPGNGAPIDGVKVLAEYGWFAARPSGTEDIFKIYAESFRSGAHLREVQQATQDALARVFRQPAPARPAA